MVFCPKGKVQSKSPHAVHCHGGRWRDSIVVERLRSALQYERRLPPRLARLRGRGRLDAWIDCATVVHLAS